MRVINPEHSKTNDTWRSDFHRYLVQQDLSQATLSAYGKDLLSFKRWLSEKFGSELLLSQVSVEDLTEFRTFLYNTRHLSVATVNRRIQTLKRFFRWLTDTKRIKEDPSSQTRFVRRSIPRRPDCLTDTEVHGLLTAAGRTQHGLSYRNYALVQLMVHAGLRVGEVVSLQHRDLRITMRRGDVVVRSGKGDKERTVPLNFSARRALRDYLQRQIEAEAEDFVFQSKRGTPIALRTVEATIASLARRAGFERQITPHMLRHTFAVNYLRSHPGHLDRLAVLLGHDSLDTTAIYTKVSQEQYALDMERTPLNIGMSDND